MLRNYLKIALRNLLKHKSFSFINIFGLSASLSVCLLAILLIRDSHSFDLFHTESDRVYRILTTPVRKSGMTEHYASSPYMVGKTLTEAYSQVELWTPLVRTFNADVRKNGNLINAAGLFTDATFFDLFGFELAAGDPATALAEPYSVILTHELAERLFKDADPMEQSLEMPAYDTKFKVSGVLAPFPGKTHLEFDALGSITTQIAMDKQPGSSNITGNWLDYYMSYNFVRLKEDASPEVVNAALSDLSKNRYRDLKLETRDMGYEFSLQALDDITPGPHFSNNMGRALPVQVLWFFSILGLIVMLSACFNYTNLTIARSLTRAREVGVRKVMGATRPQIFGQFLSEALVMALLALVLAYLLLEFLIPAFQRIPLLAEADVTLQTDKVVLAFFFGFALLVGIVAGLLPALVLSKFTPLSILQKLENVKLFRQVGLRKVLIVSQFAVSLIFILVLSIAWKQIDFAVAENFGGDRVDVVNVTMFGHSYDKLTAAYSQVPQVQKISASSHLMGTWQDSKVDVRTTQSEEPVPTRDYTVDHHFIENLGLELLAGENFPEQPNQQRETFAIVNENLLEFFSLGTPAEAIGKPLTIADSTQLVIRGVVKDFLYKPLVYNLEPLLLRYDPGNLNILNLTISGQDLPATIAALERTWKQVDKEQPFRYEFYDETVAANFAEVKDMGRVVGFLGSLGLLIACLGLLGMAIYSVETKAKEISIRKIIGASNTDLVKLLSRGYLLLLIIAAVIAVPVSFLIGKQLLQTFAFSIPLNAGVFLPGLFLLFLLGVLTIGSQTVRAALRNPVEKLRSE